VTVIVTPGTAAPLGSRILPEITPFMAAYTSAVLRKIKNKKRDMLLHIVNSFMSTFSAEICVNCTWISNDGSTPSHSVEFYC
jgi:hypothetical protein